MLARDYIRKRFETLEHISATVEERRDDEIRQLCDEINADPSLIDDESVGQRLHFAEYRLASSLRNMLLVAALSFLEGALRLIGEERAPDFGTHVDEYLRRSKGALWRARVHVVIEARGLADKVLSDTISHLDRLWLVRNCIVHAEGNVLSSRSPEVVGRALVDGSLGSVSKDGFVFLDDQAIPDALTSIDRVLNTAMSSRDETVRETN